MIPSRHSISAIAKYWLIMEQISLSWPKVVLVNPAPLGAETFACRFRDAVRGISEFGQGNQLQHTTIFPWCDDFIVTNHNGQLLIGPRQGIKQVLSNQTTTVSYGTVISGEVLPVGDTIDSPDDKVLAAIILLLELNFLQHATLTNVSEAQVQKHLTHVRPLEIIDQNGTLTIF